MFRSRTAGTSKTYRSAYAPKCSNGGECPKGGVGVGGLKVAEARKGNINKCKNSMDRHERTQEEKKGRAMQTVTVAIICLPPHADRFPKIAVSFSCRPQQIRHSLIYPYLSPLAN
jgi:hypothetical protein